MTTNDHYRPLMTSKLKWPQMKSYNPGSTKIAKNRIVLHLMTSDDH